jgi:hypothetical protein
MENNKSSMIFCVKNNYDEIQGVFKTELEAQQLVAYLNSKYLKAQPNISESIHRVKYSVHKYTVGEFHRRKKLYWLITVYFGIVSYTRLDCPYAVSNIEKTMILDYEVDETLNLRENGVHHIYFTVPFRTTKNELEAIARDKVHCLWVERNLPK